MTFFASRLAEPRLTTQAANPDRLLLSLGQGLRCRLHRGSRCNPAHGQGCLVVRSPSARLRRARPLADQDSTAFTSRKNFSFKCHRLPDAPKAGEQVSVHSACLTLFRYASHGLTPSSAFRRQRYGLPPAIRHLCDGRRRRAHLVLGPREPVKAEESVAALPCLRATWIDISLAFAALDAVPPQGQPANFPPTPITALAFNHTHTLLAAAMSYDWSKGHQGNTPQMQTRVRLHAVKPEEVQPKVKR